MKSFLTFPLGARRFTQLFVAALVAGLAIAYANGFGIGFYFDDSYGIQENPAVRSLANIPRFFSDPFTLTTVRENVDIRPVLVTTFAVNYAISGNNPWSYHAFNLIVHLLTALMVFVLVRDHIWWPVSRRGPDGGARLPAAAAALFFALAPINNQALNYMWARSALLCTAFYVAAFLAIMNRRVVAAMVLHVLALLTKAIALTLPAVFVAYDFLYRDRKRHPTFRAWLRDWKELIPPVAPLAAINVVYLFFRSRMLPDWANDALHEPWVTPWIWCISQWSALLHYVRIFFLPYGLSVDTDFPYTMNVAELRAWGSLIVILAWVGLALRYSKRYPHVAFATCWFFITLAPESTFSPLAEVVNDHRPYLASALGLSVLAAWLVDSTARLAARLTGGNRRVVFAAIVAMLCIGAAALGHRRTWQWSDELRLWESTVAASPNNGRAWMNAGLASMNRGNLKEAKRRFEKARELMPTYPYLHMNLSTLAIAEKRPKDAVESARQAVRFAPKLARAHFYLGVALDEQENYGESVQEFRRAIELDPNDYKARQLLEKASSLLAAQDAEKAEAAMMSEGLRLLDVDHDSARAIAVFRSLLERNPAHYGATFQLARALDAAGKQAEARPVWEKMLTLAQQAKDTQTEAKVRERLAKSAT